MAFRQQNRNSIAKRLCAAVAGALALTTLFSGCSVAPAAATPAPTPSEAPVIMEATATPTATPEPTPTPTPEPKNRSQTSGRVIPEGTASKIFIMSIDNAAGAKPQTSLMEADIVYEFLVEQAITRFQAVFNDTYPLYAGPLRSTRYYIIDMAQEWDCMYLHEGYVLLKKPYRRVPKDLISLYLPGGGFKGFNTTFYRKVSTYDDFETKNGYKFRAPETGRGDVHALYYRVAALVNAYYGDYESKICQRFQFLEDVSYETGTPFTNVTLSFDNKKNPDWIQFAYDAATNRLYRSESGEPSMTRTLTDNGDSYLTEQMNVQNLIVQYVDYGSVKGDPKHRRTCEMIGSGKCDYFINGQHVTGTWSRPTAEDYTSYLLDDGSLVTLEPGNTWIAVHPADSPVTID
ncbi:MAG: DUF3048 domain-containing protein [Clostridiales bacterium]|nr:DUF3048 domain-containing protein [Clostridiales bacterium]